MNVLLRNRRDIKYCEMYLDNGIEKFKEPVPVKLNFEPTNSDSQVFAYGNVYPLYLKAVINNNMEIKFKPGDKCYIYNNAPIKHDILCKNADYIVDNESLKSLNFTEVRFRRLTSDMNNG